MKKAVVILSAALCGIVLADEVVATTLLADGSTNTWTQTDLRDALGLMNRMYHRDMDTDAGRRKWHGERIGEYLLPTGVTNSHGQAQMIMVHLYQDGFVATNKAVRYRRSIVRSRGRREGRRRGEAPRRRGPRRLGIGQPPARPRGPPCSPAPRVHDAGHHGHRYAGGPLT